MRRRSVVLASLALVVAVSATAMFVVFRKSVARETLAGIDIEGARAGGRGGAEIGAVGGLGTPTLEALAAVCDAAVLRSHVASFEAALAGRESDAARGELHVMLSAAHRQLGQHDDARQHADRGVALLPDNSRARHTRARALARNLIEAGRERGWAKVLGSLGDVGEYKGELAAAIALDPTNLEARDEEIAVLLFAPWPIGDGEKARQRIEGVASVDALRGALWSAQVLAKDDRHSDALSLVDTHVSALTAPLDPGESARVALLRGQLLQALDRFADAAVCYEPLLVGRTDPPHFQALYEAAKARQRGGFELERAITLLDAYIEAAPVGDFIPPLTGAHYRRALCLRDLGRSDEARIALARALELDPKNERAKDVLEELGG